jgi:chromosome partitioning protein
MAEAIQPTHVENLDILPANPDLVGAEIELVDMPQREYRLKGALQTVDDRYAYVLIDCPPSLGLLTVNSLSASETFLVPLQCEYFALEGLSQLLNTAGLIKKSLNSELRIEGIVLTMFDARNNLSHQVVAEIQSHFSEKVFKAIIPRNVRLSEAPSHGQTIFQYDNKSVGAKRYLELAVELDARVYGKAQASAAAPTANPPPPPEPEPMVAAPPPAPAMTMTEDAIELDEPFEAATTEDPADAATKAAEPPSLAAAEGVHDAVEVELEAEESMTREGETHV